MIKLTDYLTEEEIQKYNANVLAQPKISDRRTPEECEDWEEFILWSFAWDETPEGRDYWHDIHIRDPLVKVGDIVAYKEGNYVLACGSGYYEDAVVVQTKPFVLVSRSSDMKWSCVEIQDFKKVGEASEVMMGICKRRMS